MPPESILQIGITEPEHAVLKKVPFDNSALREDEVAGPTLSSVISTGTELGLQYHAADGFPHWPGYGAVFEVTESGPDVPGAVRGSRLFCIGKHASYQRCRIGDTVKVPKGLDPIPAVLTRMSGIGWSAVTTTRARPPARVLVIGLGMVGHMAARIFTLCGYRVGAVDPDSCRRKLLKDCTEKLFESVPVGNPDWQDQTELALDCSGHEEAVYQACCLVKPGGEVAVAGVPWRPRTQRLSRDLIWKIFWRYIQLRSGWEWEVPWQFEPFRRGSFRQNCEQTMTWMQARILDINDRYQIEDPRNCQAVYQKLGSQQSDILSLIYGWSRLNSTND
jgi:threonine dehydrogenase-like Zn-dependent dehydrogenase